MWIVSRYVDCQNLLTDERFPRSPAGGSALAADMPAPLWSVMSASPAYKDGPEHLRLRRLVTKPFTPGAVERLGQRVDRLAHGLLDSLASQKEVDLRHEFALPIPITVISEMVGVPEADRDRFHHGAQALIGGLADLDQQTWRDEVNALVEFVRDLVERRRESPGDDILTGLIQAEEEGDHLDDEELVAMVFTLVTAGYETTYNLITNAVITLLDHPDQLTRLRADPALMRPAVEEVAR